ncbi:hypothetical protein Ahy_A05g023825 isoform B [Arachis hypogaea]|uniref:COPA/B second beta-propeller domain-containing protein n=1 Tax=Arachis hypogaea TaxID=3818 RepID=A0A445D4N1_ARAHY|nr:hypothetical protein Ahy_A05g023825 isoform B [Arachis hypogaea]
MYIWIGIITWIKPMKQIWDYQTKNCVQTLEGHTHNVSDVCFHPELPIIITGSEDGTVRIWHSTTYRLENTLNYGLERVWAIGCLKGSRKFDCSENYVFFQEKKSIRPTFSAEPIFGGTVLAMCSNDFIFFYNWAECRLIRRIDVNVKRDVVASYLDSKTAVDEQGVEDAFELLHEMNEHVRTGIWVGDCFVYNYSSWRLNYCVGGEVTTMSHLDRPMYLLGYLASQSKCSAVLDYISVLDGFNVMGYTLLLSLIEYKTLVMRGDLDRANEVLPSIPKEHHNRGQELLVKQLLKLVK